MDRATLMNLLAKVKAGDLAPSEAAGVIVSATSRPLGPDVHVDGERALRVGLPEVVFGEGKTAEQCARMSAEIDRLGHAVLVTRLSVDKSEAVMAAVPSGKYDPVSRTFARRRGDDPHPLRGPIAVICAGTSDVPYAEEAAVTLETVGQPVERVYDVGVAGLHRLLAKLDALRRAGVCIVAAGMEGALPSVVGGLVDVPVVAVPTPVGYGAGEGGYVAMLAMLNSCSPNVSVVNIGNGFGAAFVAALANRVGPPRAR